MKMTIKIGLLVMVLLAAGYLRLGRGGQISGAEARLFVAGGARLVDVRTPEEFAQGHIAGAVNIPVEDLDRRMGELGSKAKSLVVYCRSGSRSGSAARMLASAGYGAVHDLGAMSRW
jgi:phage shock protein E